MDKPQQSFSYLRFYREQRFYVYYGYKKPTFSKQSGFSLK